MAQIQKGTTYSTGDQVTATNLNALADAAILLPGAITDQTAKTVPLAADTVLIHSAADTALRKSTLTQLFANATGIPLTTGVTGILPATNGGTGVANASTITLAGNVTHAGAFTQSFTATANTSLTLPVTGTLATLAGSEALSNKTITASSFSGTTGAFSGQISQTGGGVYLSLTGSTTGTTYQESTTTGGRYRLGIESSTGGALAGGGTAYATVLSSVNNVPVQIAVNNSVVSTFTSTGLNSTAIGATTASTGAFTTLSATGTITSNPASGDNVNFQNGAGVSLGKVFNDVGFFNLQGSANVSGTRIEHLTQVQHRINGATVTTTTSTGLAVTGQVTASVTTTASDRAISGVNTNTSGTNYGGVFISSGTGATTHTGGYFNAAGATTNYGVRIAGPASGASSYAIYADATAQSYFAGNVGIGTTIPAKVLDVNGTVQFRDAAGEGQAFWVANKGVGSTNSGAFGLGYNAVNYTPASASSNIYWDPNNGWFTLSTSSRKYKRNIVAVTDEQLDKALLLKPSYYQRNEYEYYEYGFIAEEVNEIGLDEFVTRVEGEISGLNYEKMVTLAIGLAQRQAKENANLVAQVAALSQRLAALENS